MAGPRSSPAQLGRRQQTAGIRFSEIANIGCGQKVGEYALETMRSMHRTWGSGYFICDAFIYATRGENDLAISALRDAIDAGWGVDWWFYPRLSAFDSFRDEPEWIELMDELRADIARQRQWYEERKDDPLF